MFVEGYGVSVSLASLLWLVNFFSTNWHHHSWWKPGQGSRIMCPYSSSFRLPLKLSVKMGLPEGLMIRNNKWYKRNHPSLRDPYVMCFFTGSMRFATKLTPESPVEQYQRHAKKKLQAIEHESKLCFCFRRIFVYIYICIFIRVWYVYTIIYNMYMHINMRNTQWNWARHCLLPTAINKWPEILVQMPKAHRFPLCSCQVHQNLHLRHHNGIRWSSSTSNR